VGEFIGTIGLTVILALLSSLYVADGDCVPGGAAAPLAAVSVSVAHWWQQGFSIATLVGLSIWTALQKVFPSALAGDGALPNSAGHRLCRVCHPEQQFFPPTNRDQFQIELHSPDPDGDRCHPAEVMAARDRWP
jgi:hypothetical protein